MCKHFTHVEKSIITCDNVNKSRIHMWTNRFSQVISRDMNVEMWKKAKLQLKKCDFILFSHIKMSFHM